MLYDEIMTGKEFDRLDYDLWRAREGDNPNGMGDYPRRMIVVDNQETKNSMENENERREERAGSNNS